jgi:superfamily I DNA and RNA helicase
MKFNIGNSSYKLQDIYLNTLFAANWHNGTRYLKFDTSHNIYPDTTNAVSLGTSSKQYKNIYGQNIYVNGTAVSSDRRVKDDIKALEEKHIAFFKALRPVQFKYKEGDSGRTHTGFIAQEVEEAVEEAGMTSQDMAVVVKDPSDRYYLRYEEIISVQTKVIQDLMAKVESLEARITKLEGKGENK